MRLVCPNCGAQYEVPAEAIPPSGRDVQCSACGHTWFEPREPREAGPGAAAPARVVASPPPAAEPSTRAPDPGWSDEWADAPRVEGDAEEEDDLAEVAWDPPPMTRPPAADHPVNGLPPGGPGPDPASAAWDEEPGSPAAFAAPPAPPRSTVTPEVAEILRAEAEREARARAGEWVPPPDPHLEPDPEPERAFAPESGVDPEPKAPAAVEAVDPDRQRAEEARRRMARLRGQSAPATSAPLAPATSARRDRLPDIEEINSSLRGAPAPGAAAARAAERSGFRLGFGGVLLAAAALALLYVYAPRIVGAAPATGAVLTPYVAAIDSGRLWIDLRLQGLLRAVDDGDPGAAPGEADLSSPAAPDAPPEVQAEDPAAPPAPDLAGD